MPSSSCQCPIWRRRDDQVTITAAVNRFKFKVALYNINARSPNFGERDREEVRARHGAGEDPGVCIVGAALVHIRVLEHQLA